MLAAKTTRLSLKVHAVDDTGALCGARPRGKWTPATLIPITCPGCLWTMGRRRLAFCVSPEPLLTRTFHIRLVGPEGISFTARHAGIRTLCRKPVLQDKWPYEVERLDDPDLCPSCRLQERRDRLAA